MTKYVLNIIQEETSNTGLSKPKSDINQILTSMNYKLINVPLLIGKKQKLVGSLLSVRKIVAQLKREDTLVIQYPTYMGALFDIKLLNVLHTKHIESVALIHDIDALRVQQPFRKGLHYEMFLLNKVNLIISPNSKMTTFLKKNGLKSKCRELKVFDYLTKVDVSNKNIFYSCNVYFTGNLNKSKFIFRLRNSENVHYQLYGPLDQHQNKVAAMYNGSLSSDSLLSAVDNGFGLIWDGDSEQISNLNNSSFGSYLLYNNPYKLSFYLAAGIPVIIWAKAAEAEFVLSNHLGYTINSIDDINNLISTITPNSYQEIIQNVHRIQLKLIHGDYTRNVFDY